MLNNLKEKCVLFLIIATPLSVVAHTGHDHQSPWAFLIHLLWLAPVIVAAYMSIHFFKNRNKKP